MMGAEEFAARRKKLLDCLGPNNAGILFSSVECIRNNDVHFPFRQESNFYYFTGFSEPGALAIFLPGREEGEFILFNEPRDPNMERWVGPRAGQQGACDVYGADQSFDIHLLDNKMVELLLNRNTIFYLLGKNSQWDKKISTWLNQLQHTNSRSVFPRNLSDIGKFSSEMRLIKSKFEIETLRKVAKISAEAHLKMMEACCEGQFEYQLEAIFDHEVKQKGCRSLAYQTIVGGGDNACVLHYIDNKDPLKEGELVLIDAGGELGSYAADISRTFPVSGKFSDTQARIYQLVLDAQLAVIKEIKPGIPWNRLQEIAVEHLTSGLIELGILRGNLHKALEKKSYLAYYMHNIGHWLGLDVHDVGSYQINGQSRILEEGMVLTVEPGLYLSPNKQLDAKWWNMGVRIEDDILVTDNGCEVLTSGVPKTIKEIEAIMKPARP